MHQSLIAKHFVGVAWVLSLAGCSALINVSEKQCSDDAWCVSAGLGTTCDPVDHVCTDPNENPNGCKSDMQCGAATAPICMRGNCVDMDLAKRFLCTADAAPKSGTVNYQVDVVNYIDNMPPKNLVVRACKNADLECASAVATFTDTEGMGHVDMTLPSGFIGYFQVKSDATDSYSYITKPVTQDMKDRNIQVLKPDDLTLLSSLAGVAIDPAKGLALVEAFDCDGKPQAGVHFDESSHTGTPFYIKDGVPNRTPTVSVYNVDSNSADGGFVNLQQGPVIFSAQWNTDGPILGSVNVAIRAGTMTYVDMHF